MFLSIPLQKIIDETRNSQYTTATVERWLSGRKRLTANEVGMKVPRGFESHPLRAVV